MAPTATALRDGVFTEIPRVSIVPGDVIRIGAGDMVPADARLLESKDLHLQQSALTGESMPVEKAFKAGDESDETLVLLGTSVVSGTATALVLATGPHTRFGDIATRLRARPPETEFDRGIKQFGSLILKAVIGLVLFILVVRMATHRNAFESLLFAIALAVGLTPEFLPMITSVTLARGAVAMAKQKVIVKNLSAIQNLGSIDILCSDKTGTLTQGIMSLASSCDPFGQAADAPLFFGRLNSQFETGIKSPLDTAILERPAADGSDGYTKLDEIPFDFERRRLSIVVEKAGERLLIAKGAPEGVLDCASAYSTDDHVERPLDADTRAKATETYRALSAQGFRVLAVATRKLATAAVFTTADESDLVLIGFLAFADPPWPAAKGGARRPFAGRRARRDPDGRQRARDPSRLRGSGAPCREPGARQRPRKHERPGARARRRTDERLRAASHRPRKTA